MRGPLKGDGNCRIGLRPATSPSTSSCPVTETNIPYRRALRRHRDRHRHRRLASATGTSIGPACFGRSRRGSGTDNVRDRACRSPWQSRRTVPSGSLHAADSSRTSTWVTWSSPPEPSDSSQRRLLRPRRPPPRSPITRRSGTHRGRGLEPVTSVTATASDSSARRGVRSRSCHHRYPDFGGGIGAPSALPELRDELAYVPWLRSLR